MIGSYNYSAKARIRHFEHSVLLEPNCQATEMLRDELSDGWNAITSEEMTFPIPPTREAPTRKERVNPYGKRSKSSPNR